MSLTRKYKFFWKARDFESQWHPSQFISNDDENIREYSNAEQYMMAQKALLFGDIRIFNLILKTTEPRVIKNLGRQVKNFDNKVWDKHKYDIVVKCNQYKFSQNPSLQKLLIDTGNLILVEASPFDKVWGIGFDAETALDNIDKWGENLLGKALMEVRSKLKQST
jgi:hypothetical protein